MFMIYFVQVFVVLIHLGDPAPFNGMSLGLADHDLIFWHPNL